MGIKIDYVLGKEREDDTYCAGAITVTQLEGTEAERLALTPTTPIQFYTTDADQVWQYTITGGWKLIG